MNQIIGVLGVGEVGKAIAKVFGKQFKVLKKDLIFDEIKNQKVNVLHVCLPYSQKFEQITLSQIIRNKPQLVIINSTVKPGTTQNIFKKTKIPIVHSPVMGTHPNLAKDLLTFTKIVGPVDNNSAQLAAKHFKAVGIKTRIFKDSMESEVAKLLDTTYYGWNIIFSKVVWDICKKMNVDFEDVYTKMNVIYNTGYKKSRPNVMRPVLEYKPGKIGGHCVIPNAEILEDYLKNSVTEFIIGENKKFKK